MTTPANSKDKPSPSDTPTHRPEDNGGKAVLRPEDKTYSGDKPPQENVDKKREKDEQPVHSVKKAPTKKV